MKEYLTSKKYGKYLLNEKFIKVITGINNFKIVDIVRKIKAADIAGANYIDIAANPSIVSIAKSLTNLPVCVSAINPMVLYSCILAGADIVEIGNFDTFYSKNIYFSAQKIINMVMKTQKIADNITTCVTIPHILSTSEQMQLARNLETLGVDIIQTEGSSIERKYAYNSQVSLAFTVAYDTSCTLSSTYILSHAIRSPIVSSSSISSVSSPLAICYGASGIGIGSALNPLNTISQMAHYIREVSCSLNLYDLNLDYGVNEKVPIEITHDIFTLI